MRGKRETRQSDRKRGTKRKLEVAEGGGRERKQQ
jgi:hypothetical protein